MVYELFITRLASPAFSAKDVLDLYLHRGSFETVLADEDIEQDPDRWCSHTPCGQEFWQIISQWVWNLRLELGQHLSPAQMRTTEFAPAFEASSPPAIEPPPLPEVYGPLNGHRGRLRGAFQARLSRFNRMEACFVPPIIRSIRKNADRSAMAPIVSCMRPASAIAADARCARSVKKALPPANHDASVR